MTKKERDKIDAERYAARVIAEMAALSDAEVRALAAEEKIDVKAEAARLRAMLLDTAAAHGKKRLKRAQEAVAAIDRKAEGSGAQILTFEAKKAKLDRLLAEQPGLTRAARHGRGMEESEVDDYLADLADLGITESHDH
jgi:hypothetical protein